MEAALSLCRVRAGTAEAGRTPSLNPAASTCQAGAAGAAEAVQRARKTCQRALPAAVQGADVDVDLVDVAGGEAHQVKHLHRRSQTSRSHIPARWTGRQVRWAWIHV